MGRYPKPDHPSASTVNQETTPLDTAFKSKDPYGLMASLSDQRLLHLPWGSTLLQEVQLRRKDFYSSKKLSNLGSTGRVYYTVASRHIRQGGLFWHTPFGAVLQKSFLRTSLPPRLRSLSMDSHLVFTNQVFSFFRTGTFSVTPPLRGGKVLAPGEDRNQLSRDVYRPEGTAPRSFNHLTRLHDMPTGNTLEDYVKCNTQTDTKGTACTQADSATVVT
jgi:hypothetical protein